MKLGKPLVTDYLNTLKQEPPKSYDKFFTTFSINRTQLPVGQGGFHYCEFFVNNELKFNYIYDCGTDGLRYSYNPQNRLNNTEKLFINQINQIKGNLKNNIINILFLSHFDSDHINGVKYLLNEGIKVNKVIIPYLDDDHLYLLKLNHNLKNKPKITENDNYIQYKLFLNDSDRWLLDNFGKHNVVKIKNNNIDNNLSKYLGINLNNDITNFIINIPEDNIVGNFAEISHNSDIRLSIKSDDPAVWILKKYVYPVEPAKIKTLKHLIKIRLNLNPEDLLNNIEFFKKKDNIKLLKKIYKDCNIGTGNAISMCLYSGPFTRNLPNCKYNISYNLYENSENYRNLLEHFNNNLGWLGTGDISLNTEDKITNLINHYNSEQQDNYLNDMYSINIPHHGSRQSINELFFDSFSKFNFMNGIIPFKRNNRYRHPCDFIIQNITSYNKIRFDVTEEEKSLFEEYIEIELPSINIMPCMPKI
jgi:hypothetical protein